MANPEVFFAGDVPASTANRMVNDGRAVRLARGVYSTDTHRASDDVVRRHWQRIVAHLFPGAVVVDRSARRMGPESGFLFIDARRQTPVELPGLTIVPRQGPGPLPGDVHAGVEDLWFSSTARALADNTVPSRAVPKKGRPRRTLTETELADWIDHLVAQHGEDRMRKIRREMHELASAAGVADAVDLADRRIGAALGTRRVQTDSERLGARQRGEPYDARRIELFRALAEELKDTAPSSLPALEEDRARRATLPFFEAYFSNFIEGTEFTVDEAERVVFEGDDLGRPADAHDVVGTYQIVVDDEEMTRRPRGFDQFLDLMSARHRRVMERRPEARPGAWKVVNNQAGGHVFVAPDLLIGTLRAGWELVDEVADPFGRAAALMFVVTEVHPFADGNGRIARIMMNSELVAARETRIVIPTGYRTDYLAALSGLSADPELASSYVRVLDFARRYTAQIDWSSIEIATHQLTATNAFASPEDARDRGIRLRLPSSLSPEDLYPDRRGM